MAHEVDLSKALECTNTIEIPLINANNENLKGYGKLVNDFESCEIELCPWPTTGRRTLLKGTGLGAKLMTEEVDYFWSGDILHMADAETRNERESRETLKIGRSSSRHRRSHILVREANYHPDSGQLFWSVDGQPYVALLAPPGDEVTPTDFTAFLVSTRGLYIHPNIWHQPIFPTRESGTFVNRQGEIFACVMVDFVDEFGSFLKIPLSLGE